MDQEAEFLQSESWLAFQKATGKEAIRFSESGFSANGIVHELPLAGKYLYVPRGPLLSRQAMENDQRIEEGVRKLIGLAEEKGAGWIRIEPETEAVLASIGKAAGREAVKAPHDMQPREIFVVDISRSEEELLASMKPKTRYNIRLAEKRGVKVFAAREEKYRTAFLDLMQATADRKEIVPHSRAYYEKFFTALPEDICQLFIAEYEGRVVAANLLVIYGTTATYLHGGSGDRHRDVMAPYLLQWEQMKFAKGRGCARYDFGGVRVTSRTSAKTAWDGITRFKIGFSPQTEPLCFPGAYDIILAPKKYTLYNRLRLLKDGLTLMRKFLRI